VSQCKVKVQTAMKDVYIHVYLRDLVLFIVHITVDNTFQTVN